MFGRLAEALFAQINRVRVWHRMPTFRFASPIFSSFAAG